MTTALVAVVSVLATLVVVLLVVPRLRQPAPPVRLDPPDDQLARAITALDTRFEAILRELADSRERVRDESRRSRGFGEIAGTIDFDEVLARILEAAGALPGVDAAMLRVASDEEPVVATVGLSPSEVEDVAQSVPSGRGPRSITVAFDYGDGGPGGAGAIRAAVGVPLALDGAPLGVLTVFSRTPGRAFGEHDVRELEELAARAAPAIENARQFRQARQLADLDALTSLHNRRFFHETLAREVARAHRYQRNLALVLFDLDDFKAINDRIGHLAGDAVLAEVAERVRVVVRSADVACRIGGDEFAIILPESTLADADQLYTRLRAAVSDEPFGQAGRLRLSAGVTDLRVGDDAVSFFKRTDEALYRAKDEGKDRLVAARPSPP